MRFDALVLAALGLILPSVATLAPVYNHYRYPSDRYIVKLKPGVDISSICEATNTSTLHEYKVINGFAAKLDHDQLEALHNDPNVEYVKKDMIANATSIVSQHDAPWGLARLSTRDTLIDQNPNHMNFTYTYDSTAGNGVDIYILGVYVEHDEFGNGQTATLGPNFVEFMSNEDLNGHGTHCAGIAAGRQFGVAKHAQIISVKVLDDEGFGSTADIIMGMDWVYRSASSGKPSVVSMSFSLSTQYFEPLDEAITSLTDSGVHVVVAAGNNDADAFLRTPAHAPTAITVGSIDITDTRDYDSNSGCLVDIHAPGVNIISAWIGCPDSLEIRSGTSTAAPQVAGLVASLISADGNISPAAMKVKLKALAVEGAIANIPFGTPNHLAQNGLAS